MTSKRADEGRIQGDWTKREYKKLYINNIMWLWNKDPSKVCKAK